MASNDSKDNCKNTANTVHFVSPSLVCHPKSSHEGGVLSAVDGHYSMMESKEIEALVKSVRAQLQNENDKHKMELTGIQVTIWM